jgi:predicted RNA-binding protein with PIN domain
MSLVKIIQEKRLTGSRNNRVTIVFDGKENYHLDSPGDKQQVKIIFSCQETADEVIKRIVSKSANPKQTVVVTNDRSIAYFIRSLGTKVISVSDFLNKPKKRLDKRPPIRHKSKRNHELAKVELTHQQQAAINQELSRIWK